MPVWLFNLFGSPCIWTKNSVLMRRAASLSFSFLEPHSESTSSMKMIEGLCWRARSNKFFTNLGDARRDGANEIGRHRDSYIHMAISNISFLVDLGTPVVTVGNTNITGHRTLEAVKLLSFG